jgi:hypothetical protein
MFNASTDKLLNALTGEFAPHGEEMQIVRVVDLNVLPGVTSDEGPGPAQATGLGHAWGVTSRASHLSCIFCCAFLLATSPVAASTVEVTDGDAARASCAAAATSGPAPRLEPQPLRDSVPVRGTGSIEWVWLASPTQRYTHAALGSSTHAASLHATLRGEAGQVVLRLPDDRVIEDRLPRLVDLDGDGQEEVVVVESHVNSGGSIVVYAIERGGSGPRWVERARSAPVGVMRWLNPVGFADFDGDGRPEIVSVTTPHIGGVLTLYRYSPPRLLALSTVPGVSNHRLGSPEQRMSAILQTARGPLAIVPGTSFRRLLSYAWSGDRGWHQAAPVVALSAGLERLLASEGSACAELSDGGWLRLRAL